MHFAIAQHATACPRLSWPLIEKVERLSAAPDCVQLDARKRLDGLAPSIRLSLFAQTQLMCLIQNAMLDHTEAVHLYCSFTD